MKLTIEEIRKIRGELAWEAAEWDRRGRENPSLRHKFQSELEFLEEREGAGPTSDPLTVPVMGTLR